MAVKQHSYAWALAESGNLKELVARGCEAFYREIFGDKFWDSLDSAETNDEHHTEAIYWHWNARLSLLKGRSAPNDEMAYFPIWARGNMKSSIAETMVIVDAMLSVAYKQAGYCLYVGREKDRIKENIGNLEALLSRAKVREYAPQLSEVAKNDETNSKRQWTGTFLHTKAGYIIKGGTVESTQAGSRIKHLESDNSQLDTRVTFCVPDDIDSREDSPVISENRFKLLTTEILPMRQANTLTFFAQNLISRFSVMYRIQKGGAKVLTNRKLTEPIPAVRGLMTEQRTVNGIVKDVVLAGKCTWRVWGLSRVQAEIDTMGLPAFLREMQHEVEQDKEGLIIYNYDDNVHVISESEFALKYGKDAWKTWRKKPGNDWARTKTDKHANVAGWLMRSPQNCALPNITFFKPYSFPSDSAPEDVVERLLSELSLYAYKNITWEQLRKDLLRRANSDIYTKTVGEKMEYERGELGRVIPQYSKPLLQRCNVQQGDMSHEADTVRKIYTHAYGLAMRPSNPGKHGGIEKLIQALRIDYETSHPFRPDVMGYTQWFIIAPDDKSRPYQVRDVVVYHPKLYPEAYMSDALTDSDLARFQFSNYRKRDPKLTETGEIIDDPLKLHDDFPNMCQMLYTGADLHGDSLSFDQKVELLMPQESIDARKEAKTGFEKLAASIEYDFQREIAEGILTPEDEEYEEIY